MLQSARKPQLLVLWRDYVFLFFAGHVLAPGGTAPARVRAQNAGSAPLPSVQPGHLGENGAAAALLVGEVPEAGPGEKNVFLVSVRFCIFYLACLLQWFCMNQRCLSCRLFFRTEVTHQRKLSYIFLFLFDWYSFEYFCCLCCGCWGPHDSVETW